MTTNKQDAELIGMVQQYLAIAEARNAKAAALLRDVPTDDFRGDEIYERLADEADVQLEPLAARIDAARPGSAEALAWKLAYAAEALGYRDEPDDPSVIEDTALRAVFRDALRVLGLGVHDHAAARRLRPVTGARAA